MQKRLFDDSRGAIERMIAAEIEVLLDPRRSGRARALINRGRLQGFFGCAAAVVAVWLLVRAGA